MPPKYERRIRDYCVSLGIAVPPGFGRHTPSRYAIVRMHFTPPRLIAATWFKLSDVQYYIEHVLQPELGDALRQSIRVLDFKEGAELVFTSGRRLARVATFSVSPERDEEGAGARESSEL